MNIHLNAAWAFMLCCAGVLTGHWVAKLPKPYWLLGYVIPLFIVLLYGVAAHFPLLSFTPPISWIMLGHKKFALLGFIITLILTTPLSRLPRKQDRRGVFALMVVMAFVMPCGPF